MSEETKSGSAESDKGSYYKQYFPTSSDSAGDEPVGAFPFAFVRGLPVVFFFIFANWYWVLDIDNLTRMRYIFWTGAPC